MIKAHHWVTLFALLYLITVSGICFGQKISDDLSGTWIGDYSIGTFAIRAETYLVKAPYGRYDGMVFQTIKASDGSLTQQSVKKALRCTVSGNTLLVVEYKVLEITPNTPYALTTGVFEITKAKGQRRLVPLHTPIQGFSVQTSIELPEVYKRYFNPTKDATTPLTLSAAPVKTKRANPMPIDTTFIGTWLNTAPNPTGASALDRDRMELEENGIGIARNHIVNTIRDASVFGWFAKEGTLWLRNADRLPIKFSFTITNGQLEIRENEGSGALHVFQRASADAYRYYRAVFPPDSALGNWASTILSREADTLEDPHFTYSFYPSSKSGVFGEIVIKGENDPIDSMTFIKFQGKYNLTGPANNILRHSELLNSINRYVPMFNDDQPFVPAHNQIYKFSFFNMDRDDEEVDCFFNSGVIILDRPFGRYYLIKSGAPLTESIVSLHNRYNKDKPQNQQLLSVGTHWATCLHCGGSGKVSITESRINGYNNNGYEKIEHYEKEITCPLCRGEGGAIISDETAEPQ